LLIAVNLTCFGLNITAPKVRYSIGDAKSNYKQLLTILKI
ncbi:MAG: hypothetical protein ACI9RM_001361, partial [Ulvibacter sp.]